MNIIIPLGGDGVRFKQFGYTQPKPLIKVLGKEIILRVLDSIKFNKKDNFYIIYNESLKDYNFQNYFYYHKNINLIPLNKKTKGPLETVVSIKDIILFEKNIDTPLLLIDGDTLYNKDILKLLRSKKNNAIFYSKTKQTKAIYSYIKFNKQGNITDIKEKEKISDNFNTGAYFFSNTKQFFDNSLKVLKKRKKAYISDVYKKYLQNKSIVESVYLNKKDFSILGTPKELINFVNQNKETKKRFCFDLDNTLVSYPKIKGDYSTCEPINKNIVYLNHLKKLGHYIIIYTARRMKTFQGDVKKVKKNIESLTINQINKLSIQYDELVFGKPYADFYIDDLAINAYNKLEFELGFYYDQNKLSKIGNKLTIGEKFSLKFSDSKKINLESKFIKDLPNHLKKYFPKIIKRENLNYKMKTIHGVDFAKLLKLNLLKNEHLQLMLKTLEIIHKSIPTKLKKHQDNKIYYANYLNKFLSRKRHLDTQIIKKYNFFFKIVEQDLFDYENNKLAKLGLVHGDPVFSNIILTNEKKIVFIDPRGSQGEKFNMYGDIYYDLSKIYQSLTGYDFIIEDNEIPKYNNIHELKKNFELYVVNSSFDLNLIKKITRSLYLSLIPLHETINEKKIIEFLINKF